MIEQQYDRMSNVDCECASHGINQSSNIIFGSRIAARNLAICQDTDHAALHTRYVHDLFLLHLLLESLNLGHLIITVALLRSSLLL